MTQAVIGALRAVFGADTAAFEAGLTRVDRESKKSERRLKKFAKSTAQTGKALSIGLSAPLAALGGLTMKAATVHREAVAQVEAGLASMGGASGKTTEELKAAALELEQLINYNADDILKTVSANFLTFGNISGEAFDRAQQAALDLSTRLDQDLKSSTIQIGKALNDPIKGITALSRVGIQFTDDQKAMIEKMQEAGDVAGAQSLILGELERQYKGSALAAQDAAPGSDLQDAYAQFSRVVGELALQVLPPLTAALSKVLGAFNNLSPPMQKAILIAGAVVAAIGPVLVALGGIISISAPLIAAISATVTVTGSAAAAMGGLGAAFTAALGPIGLLIAAAAGLTLAYKKYKTSVEEARGAHKDLYDLIDANKARRAQQKTDTLANAAATLEEAKAARELLKVKLEAKQAEFNESVKDLGVTPMGGGLFAAAKGVLTGDLQAVGAANDIVKGLRDEIAEETANIEKINRRIEALKNPPKTDTDTDSGKHTGGNTGGKKRKAPTPDRHKAAAEGIRAEIAENKRLAEALKVSETEYRIVNEQLALIASGYKGSTAAARAEAEALVATQIAMEGIRAKRQELANQEAEAAAKKQAAADKEAAAIENKKIAHAQTIAGIKAEIEANAILTEALKISNHEHAIQAAILEQAAAGFQGTAKEARALAEELVKSRGVLAKAQDAADKTGAAIGGSFDKALDSFTGLVNGIKSGDLGSILEGVAGIISQIFGDKSGGGSGGGLSDLFGVVGSIFGGFKAKGGPVERGKSYIVGEQGPELFTPGRSGGITANKQIGGGAMGLKVIPSPYFNVVVDGRSARVANALAPMHAGAAVSNASRQAQRRQGKALA